VYMDAPIEIIQNLIHSGSLRKSLSQGLLVKDGESTDDMQEPCEPDLRRETSSNTAISAL
jgi:hypothetical protein